MTQAQPLEVRAETTRTTSQTPRKTAEVPRGYIQCKAQYTGCLNIVPKKEARCIEGKGLSCEVCYEQDLHTHD